tara:strand:+ start:436 stop:1227 length:792 start_codon:yes stop_codon:yes gene_type:complete
MSDEITTYRIKELSLERINPNTSNYMNPDQGGSKIFVIGKPGTGKSTLIKSLIYYKKHIIPCIRVASGTEDSNGTYRKFVPSTFVFNKYDEEEFKEGIKRQKLAKKHLPNPWRIELEDDCTEDPKIFKSSTQQSMMKNGRHYKELYIVSLQYAMDIRPNIRVNIDGTFILRETQLNIRRVLYENFAGIIPDFSLFCQLMDELTTDFTAMYIDNASKSNNWQDCVFYYRADTTKIPSDFKFGCPDIWDFHFQRYNPEYVDPIVV